VRGAAGRLLIASLRASMPTHPAWRAPVHRWPFASLQVHLP